MERLQNWYILVGIFWSLSAYWTTKKDSFSFKVKAFCIFTCICCGVIWPVIWYKL